MASPDSMTLLIVHVDIGGKTPCGLRCVHPAFC